MRYAIQGGPSPNNHNTADIRDELGAIYVVKDHVLMYVRATAAAIAAGDAVMWNPAEVSVTNITGFSATTDEVNGVYPYIEDTGESWVANTYKGMYLYVAGNTGAGQMKRIRENTATRAYYEALFPELGEAHAFSTAVDITSDIVIVSPYRVTKLAATTKTNCCIGVAPAAFTASYYGYICVGGPAIVGYGTNGATVVVGSPVGPADDTAGQVSGFANGADANDYARPLGYALHASADNQAIPVWVNLL